MRLQFGQKNKTKKEKGEGQKEVRFEKRGGFLG